MKIFRSFVSVFITAVIALSVFAFPSAAETVKTKKLTMPVYTSKNLSFKKPDKTVTYKCSVKGNKNKNIEVDFKNEGKTIWLYVKAKKKTDDDITISVYYKTKVANLSVKKYSIKVTPVRKLDFEDVRINPKTTKSVTLKNPYDKDLTFKYSTKKYAEIDPAYTAVEDSFTYNFKAKKKGSETVKVYLGKTKKLLGQFKITVAKTDTTVLPEYETLTLLYNKHGSSVYMSESHIMLTDLLQDVKYKAKYTATLSGTSVVDKITEKSDSTRGEKKTTDMLYATGKGSATAVVYEKLTGKKKKQIATFKIKVKKAPMNYVADENMKLYDEGLFGNGEGVEAMTVGDTLNVGKTVKSALINNTWTSSHFKKSLYKITYKTSAPNKLPVSADGIVTAKKVTKNDAKITYTITFSDKSVFKGKAVISVNEAVENA